MKISYKPTYIYKLNVDIIKKINLLQPKIDKIKIFKNTE